MNSPVEMHPRILARRKAVFMDTLKYVSPEDAEREMEAWVSHFAKELPKPKNYPKKSLPHLRKLLGRIDHYIELVSSPRWGDMSVKLSAMYGVHRGHVIKELARRMVKRA